MAWNLTGTYFENCNCDVLCPCVTSGLAGAADQDRCKVLLAFHIDSGRVDGVDVGGLNVALVADTPQVMAQGNWRAALVVDSTASDAQAEKLTAVFGGAVGGPPAVLSPLIGEMLGVLRAPIDYTNDGRRHGVRIGDSTAIEIEDIALLGDGGEVVKVTGVFHPVASTLTVAKATKSKVSVLGLEFTNEGKNGHYAPFSWAA